MEHFTRAASKEFGARGISVTAVGPGPMDTPFFYPAEGADAVDYLKNAAALSPFSKTGLTDIDDVVPFIRHLVSEGWWITGQTILINGGFSTVSHAAAATAVAACLRKPFMHVTLVIAGGIVLLGLFLLFGKLWDAGPALAAGLFLPTWLAVALVNLWVGVQHAGYGLREELPILLLVFLVPAALAGVAIWLAPR